MNQQNKTTRNIVLFALVMLSVGWLGRLLDAATGAEVGEGIGLLVWIIAPIGTAAALRFRGGDGWTDAGLKLRFRGNRPWYAISLLFYPLVLGIAVGSGFLLDEFTVEGGASFPFGVFATAFAVALLPVLLTAIAEEFGWRGYLVARLDAAGVGRWSNHLLVGLIWGAWHIPYVTVFWDYTDESLTTLLPRILIGTIVVAVVYGEIRRATGSVWPAVLMHGIGNAFAGALLADEVLDHASSAPIVFSPGADGLVVIGLTILGALAIVAISRRPGASIRRAPVTIGSSR